MNEIVNEIVNKAKSAFLSEKQLADVLQGINTDEDAQTVLRYCGTSVEEFANLTAILKSAGVIN